MSSISSVSAAPFTPPVDNSRAQVQRAEKADKAAEKAAQKTAELTATAVAAESSKDRVKGALLDIRI